MRQDRSSIFLPRIVVSLWRLRLGLACPIHVRRHGLPPGMAETAQPLVAGRDEAYRPVVPVAVTAAAVWKHAEQPAVARRRLLLARRAVGRCQSSPRSAAAPAPAGRRATCPARRRGSSPSAWPTGTASRWRKHGTPDPGRRPPLPARRCAPSPRPGHSSARPTDQPSPRTSGPCCPVVAPPRAVARLVPFIALCLIPADFKSAVTL